MHLRRHQKKEIFVIEKNQGRPKYYSSHRSRQSSKKNLNRIWKDENNTKKKIKKDTKNILEIGFGTGDSIIDLYHKNQYNYYCIESYDLGINKINKFISHNKIKNIYIYQGDAVKIVEENFTNDIFDEILIFFPDPWPKKRHRKRRILNMFSLNLFLSKLKFNGILHFTTDHIDYAYSIKKLITDYTSKETLFNNNRRLRPITNYEKRGIKRKNFFFDIVVTK